MTSNWTSANIPDLTDKVIIVTGAAMGFGAGIARGLFEEGANVVIADINEEAGKEFKEKLDKLNILCNNIIVLIH